MKWNDVNVLNVNEITFSTTKIWRKEKINEVASTKARKLLADHQNQWVFQAQWGLINMTPVTARENFCFNMFRHNF